MVDPSPSQGALRTIGRYALYSEIAAGGMATVHVGRMLGPVGFAKVVAIKRLHPHFAKDPEFVSMFLDEARLAARIQHPNVVSTLDVVAAEGEIFLVMEYIHGEVLSRLMRACQAAETRCPPSIAASIVVGALHGLHHAHEAKSSRGESLGLIHRDVSPQNVLIGVDGIPRLLDFGVAKAAGRLSETREGEIKGKLAYMAPEIVTRHELTRSVDIYATGVVLWELLVGRRLFAAESEGAVLAKVMLGDVPLVSAEVSGLERFDAIVAKALARSPSDRYQTARAMALDLEKCGFATASEIGEWVRELATRTLDQRTDLIAKLEETSDFRVIRSSPRPAALKPMPHEAMPIALPRVRTGVEPIVAAPMASVDDASREEAATVVTAAVPLLEPTPEPTRARVPIRVAALVAAAVLFSGIAGWAASSWSRGDTASASGPAPSVAPVAPPTVTPAPSDTPSPPPTHDDRPPEPVPTASAITSHAAPIPSSPPSAAQVRTNANVRKPALSRAECDPPYTIDEKGHKRFKLECVRGD